METWVEILLVCILAFQVSLLLDMWASRHDRKLEKNRDHAKDRPER